jgi:hypothetical protein
MQEFSSVTASSYDAESLAPMLTEKAREGWAVVSIVSAGTNVIAYLTRSGGTEAAPAEVVAAEAVVARDVTMTPTLPGAVAIPVVAEPKPASQPEVGASSEPAGWGAAPADDVPTLLAAAAEAANNSAPSVPTVATVPAVAAVATVAAVASDAISGASDVAEGAPAVGAAAASEASGAPAGWYADPSARFELRYWDGVAWTEHVSRAGQQYTDPPVA